MPILQYIIKVLDEFTAQIHHVNDCVHLLRMVAMSNLFKNPHVHTFLNN